MYISIALALKLLHAVQVSNLAVNGPLTLSLEISGSLLLNLFVLRQVFSGGRRLVSEARATNGLARFQAFEPSQ